MKLAPALEHARSVTVTDASGHRVPVRIRAGKIVPTGMLASGERLHVTVTVRRSSLVGWLVGGNERVKATIVTPTTGVRSTLLHLAPGAPVDVHLRAPASVVVLKLPGYKQQRLEFAKPRQIVQTGVHATGPNRFGVLVVSTAARPWEKLSAPERVSWFPAGSRLEALVKPAPGATIQPSTPIELTFSEPVASVLGQVRPKLDPATPGTWVQTAPNQLTFTPSGAGLPARAARRADAAHAHRPARARRHEDGRVAHLGRPRRLDATAPAAARASSATCRSRGRRRAGRTPPTPSSRSRPR